MSNFNKANVASETSRANAVSEMSKIETKTKRRYY